MAVCGMWMLTIAGLPVEDVPAEGVLVASHEDDGTGLGIERGAIIEGGLHTPVEQDADAEGSRPLGLEIPFAARAAVDATDVQPSQGW
jgi:hypothetical protein